MPKPKLRTFKGSFTCRWAPSDGEDGAYTAYSYNISKKKTSKNSSTAPTDCYYSTWQDAPIATTETYPFLWMKMERKNDASDKSVSYVCVTGDKGDKGDPGDNGTDGNGIASQVSLFVATDKKAVASYGSVSGWSNLFSQPTEQKPYVWKCVKTTYTKKPNTYSTPELVTIYQSGTNGNILRNASFTDSGNMEAWVTQSKYSMLGHSAPIGDGEGIDTSNKLHGHNSYFDRCSGVSGAANYKDVLVQTIHHPNGGLNNIVNGQWYTLSFWAKRATNVITLNKTVSATSYAIANVYLKAGIEYAISVQSTVSSASYPIATTVTLNGTSAASLIIRQTASGRKTDYLTPSTSGIYVIRSIVGGSTGKGTVTSYAVDDSRDLSTYLTPSLVDTGSKIYVDNEERTPSADLAVVWSLAGEWSFHTLTFKAASSLTASVEQQLFFRLDSVPHVDLWRKVWICEPKLESGMMYTGYVDSSEDLKGIPGLIERTSEWVAGVEYHNDSNLTGGIRYRDIVTVTDTKGNFEIYVCQKTHLSTTLNAPKTGEDSAEWLHINNMQRPIYTPLIIADNAVLRFGQTNRMLITNSKQNVQGCFGGVEDEVNGYPLWIGEEIPEKAKYKVSYGGQLNATEVNISGNINATSGTFNNVTISSGKIAGFSISGNGLTNDPFTNDAYVVFRNDSKSCFAGIGGNVLPTSSGLRSVARFENNDDTNQWGLDKNIAMYLSAKNGTYNYAFVGSGNGILDGCICGIGFETVTNNKEKTVFVLNPTKSLFFFASDSSKNGGIGLPTLSSLRAFLGVSDTKEFCVAIEIVLTNVRDDGSFVYGRNSYVQGMDTDEYPTANWNQKKSKYGEAGSGWVDNYFIAGYNKVILHYRNGQYMATLAQSTRQTEVHSTE